jgi:hypothetical protein
MNAVEWERRARARAEKARADLDDLGVTMNQATADMTDAALEAARKDPERRCACGTVFRAPAASKQRRCAECKRRNAERRREKALRRNAAVLERQRRADERDDARRQGQPAQYPVSESVRVVSGGLPSLGKHSR